MQTSVTPRPARDGHALRIGIVGCGRMAQSHAGAMALVRPAVSLAGLADPSETARAQAAAALPGVPLYATLGGMLAEARPDVVHIVTPPHTHADLAREAIEAGIHVYLEKPFTPTTAEAGALYRLAEERGVLLCPGHQLLYGPPTVAIRRYLPALGRVVHVESYFSFRPVRNTPGGRAPLRADLQLLDVLPHPAYLLIDLMERVGEGPLELVSLRADVPGTVHATLRKGHVTGALVMTLEGRPVESYLRVVGARGALLGDYVRSTVFRDLGPGTSGIDKLLAPYRRTRQLLFGTTAALFRRFVTGRKSYPGLSDLFAAFYQAVRTGTASPVTEASVLETVRLCERTASAMAEADAARLAGSVPPAIEGRGVLVSGGTGFLGREVLRALVRRGRPVRCLARREPSSWQRLAGVEYLVADLGSGAKPAWFDGIEAVIHCAAETAGGWEDHQRNSLDATEHFVRGAAGAGVTRFLHVSSNAVVARSRAPLSERHPREPDSRGQGPYVWGKLESERLAVRLGAELGVEVKVVRPGALVDYEDLDPPGRLGKRLGNVFVAVGSPGHPMGVTDVRGCGDTLAWAVDHWGELPSAVNLLEPDLPTKRDLVRILKRQNPDLGVVWLPTLVLHPLSWGAWLLQKALRPGRPPINVAKVFAPQRWDTALSREVAARRDASRAELRDPRDGAAPSVPDR
jgi:predicted dehydrogenase/nucleoside-diphosphate-sugar epimerase